MNWHYKALAFEFAYCAYLNWFLPFIARIQAWFIVDETDSNLYVRYFCNFASYNLSAALCFLMPHNEMFLNVVSLRQLCVVERVYSLTLTSVFLTVLYHRRE